MTTTQKINKKPTVATLFASGVLLLSNPTTANAIDPIAVNCMGKTVGSIEILGDSNDPLMYGWFEHNKTSFVEAATQCWGGHFNWFQIAKPSMGIMPPMSVPMDSPFVDPLSGGNGGTGNGAVADNLPFYFNEKSGEGIAPETLLTNQILGKRLFYEDSPMKHPNGGMIEFETYLVSVPGGIGQMDKMTFHILTGFKWKFTQVNSTTRTTTNLMPITPDLKKINEVLKKQYNFPNWTAIDINHHSVPEPSLILGLALVTGVGLWVKRN